MLQTIEFYEKYSPVKVSPVPNRIATLWISKYSNKIGIRQTSFEIEVPSFLLNVNPNTVAYLNDLNKLVVQVAAGQSAAVVLPSSLMDWSCMVTASRRDVNCRIERLGSDDSKVIIETTSYQPIEIEKIVLNRVL